MVVLTKPGVAFTTIAPAGFDILAALQLTAQDGPDLTITSACDGEHSGPDDPHHRGEAYDIRSHDLPDPISTLQEVQHLLGPKFFAFIEDEGTPNAHIHIQLRHGEVYP